MSSFSAIEWEMSYLRGTSGGSKHRNTAKKINEHRITARKVNETRNTYS